MASMYDGWDEGRLAAERGLKVTDCPHPPTSYSYVTWHTGWANTIYWMANGIRSAGGKPPEDEFKSRAIKNRDTPQRRRSDDWLFE